MILKHAPMAQENNRELFLDIYGITCVSQYTITHLFSAHICLIHIYTTVNDELQEIVVPFLGIPFCITMNHVNILISNKY